MVLRLLSALLIVYMTCASQPAQAVSESVTANIAFGDPLEVSSTQDLSLPVLITINTFGSVWIDRHQSALDMASDQRHDSINFTGPNNQLMNFLTLAYSGQSSGKMVPIESVCSLGGKNGEGCNKLYGSIQNDKKAMYTGMDTVFLTNLAPSASKNNKLSIFDLCAVYQ